MPDESIKILIEADDQASRELVKTNARIKQQVGSIQEAGQKAKVSTELVGTFAAAFGGSEVAGFAGEVAQMSDRVREFGEVGKQGKLTALAFKAALVGGVAVVAVKIGSAIGNLVFQTEKWNRKLEQSIELSGKLASKIAQANQEAFDVANQEIELFRDPAEQEAQLKSLFDVTARNVAGTEAKVRRLRKETEEWADSWQITGERKAMAKMAEQELAQAEELLEVQTQQRNELLKRLSPAQREFEERKKIFQLQEKSDGYLATLREEVELLKASKDEQYKILAARNTHGDMANVEAERLLKERDALKAKAQAEIDAAKAKEDAEKQAAKVAEDAMKQRMNAAKKMADMERGAIQNLQQQVIALSQGEQAARQFELQVQGFDKDMAAKMAAAESKIAKLNELKDKDGPTDPGQITAVQSRLLSRGPGSRLFEQEKQNEQKKISEDIRKGTFEVRDAIMELKEAFNENQGERQDALRVEVVR